MCLPVHAHAGKDAEIARLQEQLSRLGQGMEGYRAQLDARSADAGKQQAELVARLAAKDAEILKLDAEQVGEEGERRSEAERQGEDPSRLAYCCCRVRSLVVAWAKFSSTLFHHLRLLACTHARPHACTPRPHARPAPGRARVRRRS